MLSADQDGLEAAGGYDRLASHRVPPPPPLEIGSVVALSALWVCELPAGTTWSASLPAPLAVRSGVVDRLSEVAWHLACHGWQVEALTQYPSIDNRADQDPLYARLRSWMRQWGPWAANLSGRIDADMTLQEWAVRSQQRDQPGTIYLEHSASSWQDNAAEPDGTGGWLLIEIHAPAKSSVPLEIAVAGVQR